MLLATRYYEAIHFSHFFFSNHRTLKNNGNLYIHRIALGYNKRTRYTFTIFTLFCKNVLVWSEGIALTISQMKELPKPSQKSVIIKKLLIKADEILFPAIFIITTVFNLYHKMGQK